MYGVFSLFFSEMAYICPSLFPCCERGRRHTALFFFPEDVGGEASARRKGFSPLLGSREREGRGRRKTPFLVFPPPPEEGETKEEEWKAVFPLLMQIRVREK